MKKVLFVATVVKLHIMVFHIPYLELFKKKGYEVHVAARNDYENKEDCNIPFCDKFYDLPFERSPIKRNNIQVYKELKEIIDSNDYNIIHCHTPMGGVLGRLAARKARKKGSKVIYTAHGFHFYRGASTKNWLLFYPIEKWLAKHTDTLITINEEDYIFANKKNFKADSIKLVHGVGIDLSKFYPQTQEKKIQLRKEYGYKEKDFILFCAAELNYNKHQDLFINAVSILNKKIPNIRLLLAGNGPLFNHYKRQASDLCLSSYICFLGYRNDIKDLLLISDIAVSASRREGLPVNIMEAMATGLPLVVTNVRGNRDLVKDGLNGFVFELDNVNEFTNAVEKIYKDVLLSKEFGKKNTEIIQKYSLVSVLQELEMIYNNPN